MENNQEGYSEMLKVVNAQANAQVVSKYNKRKIPSDLRRHWYIDIVVAAIYEYNNKCAAWLQDHGG